MKYVTLRKNNDNNNLGLFDDFFNDFFTYPSYKENHHNFMKTDIKENENDYSLEVELPGVDKKDINVELEDGYLTISTKKEENNEEEKKNYIRKERYSGSYSRSYYVGDIAEDQIKASYNNGILSLSLPKESKQEEPKKTIAIE